MGVAGAAVGDALGATWESVFTTLDGGWTASDGGALAGVTGLPIPTLNGIWPTAAATLDVTRVTALVDRVAADQVPYCIQARPVTALTAAQVAAAFSMVEADPIPIMVLDDLTSWRDESALRRLQIRRLSPDEAHVHADVAARGFGVPVDVFGKLANRTLLDMAGVAAYIGVVDDEPVTTGMAVALGGSIGIFNIATPEQHRRKGYGRAVTAAAITDGRQAGGQWAWLQSSPDGFGVYERLGFRTVERWSCWVSAS